MNQNNSIKEQSVLFVCMGNICRSPTAEGVLRVLHARLAPGLKLRVDSAGTHAYYHLGEPPDRRSQQAAIARGYDIGTHRARMVTAEDFRDFDYVLAMDSENLRNLKTVRRAAARAEVGLLLEYARGQALTSVPDPYYEGPAGFERVLDLVEQGVLGLLQVLCRDQDIEFSPQAFIKANSRR